MRHVVGIAEMRISADKEDELVTHALGSCLGVAIYDPVAGVGGLLHVMLPLSTIDPEKAAANPCMFIDTGVPALFRACYEAGARKQRLRVHVAGGAATTMAARPGGNGSALGDYFQIGKRNFLMLRKLLWKNGVLLHGFDVGGTHSRTMALAIGTGEVTVFAQGSAFRL
jgi:chemotaxis protein CheD